MERTPAEDGLSMPAEWTPHDGCYISWPVNEEVWFGFIDEVRLAYSKVIKAINQFEPVTVLADPSTAIGARTAIGSDIELIEIPLDDAWIRDNGPIFVTSEEKETAAVQFGHNGWGGRYLPFDKDAKVPSTLAKRLKMRCYKAPMILEGGSICVDGEGTLLTTESCLLNPNRNPQLTGQNIEDVLKDYLGAKKILWLKQGLNKSMVDGHIDGIAAFVRPSTVLLAQTDDTSNPNHKSMRENKEHLSTLTDAKGRSIEIIDFPMPTRVELKGKRLASCYANFYIANRGIVAPVFGEKNDEIALEILKNVFPKHEVVGIRSEYIALGGGDVHCITQQKPKGISIPP